MELDNLKKDWNTIMDQSLHQNKLSPEEIEKIVQRKYTSKINKIRYPEWVGAIICALAVVYLIFNFSKFSSVLFQIIAFTTMLLLISIAAIGLISMGRFKPGAQSDLSYSYIIGQFARQKKRFLQYQRVNAILAYILLIAVILLLPELFYKKNISRNRYFFSFALSSGYIFLLFFSRWTFKFYKKSINEAESLLKNCQE